jgi:hypothetical protein
MLEYKTKEAFNTTTTTGSGNTKKTTVVTTPAKYKVFQVVEPRPYKNNEDFKFTLPYQQTKDFIDIRVVAELRNMYGNVKGTRPVALTKVVKLDNSQLEKALEKADTSKMSASGLASVSASITAFERKKVVAPVVVKPVDPTPPTGGKAPVTAAQAGPVKRLSLSLKCLNNSMCNFPQGSCTFVKEDLKSATTGLVLSQIEKSSCTCATGFNGPFCDISAKAAAFLNKKTKETIDRIKALDKDGSGK